MVQRNLTVPHQQKGPGLSCWAQRSICLPDLLSGPSNWEWGQGLRWTSAASSRTRLNGFGAAPL